MFLGTAIHAAVLEPEVFASVYLPMPKLDRRTKDGKALYEALQIEAAEKGKLLIGADDFTACQSIAEVVRSHPAAKVLFAQGMAEQSIYWTDEETGVLCKCRPDWLGKVCLDVKSTDDASPDGFRRSILKWNYHTQAAWYLDGIEAATGNRPGAFVFAAFEKKAPYAAAFYYADDAMIEAGRAQYRKALRTYADCVARNEWPGYSNQIEMISLPVWAQQQGEEE